MTSASVFLCNSTGEEGPGLTNKIFCEITIQSSEHLSIIFSWNNCTTEHLLHVLNWCLFVEINTCVCFVSFSLNVYGTSLYMSMAGARMSGLSALLLLLCCASLAPGSPRALAVSLRARRLCGMHLVDALLFVCGDRGLFYQPGRRVREEDIRKG